METIQERIREESTRLTALSVSADNTSAIVDAGESLAAAREALAEGEFERAKEWVQLAHEQLNCAEEA
jgi:cellobiose-specific phosphotransferase system component IIA